METILINRAIDILFLYTRFQDREPWHDNCFRKRKVMNC